MSRRLLILGTSNLLQIKSCLFQTSPENSKYTDLGGWSFTSKDTSSPASLGARSGREIPYCRGRHRGCPVPCAHSSLLFNCALPTGLVRLSVPRAWSNELGRGFLTTLSCSSAWGISSVRRWQGVRRRMPYDLWDLQESLINGPWVSAERIEHQPPFGPRQITGDFTHVGNKVFTYCISSGV